MHNVNHRLDIFVRIRLLFCQPFASQRLNYDTAGLEFLLNFLGRYALLCSSAAHYPSGTMTGGAKRLSHRSFLTEKKVGCCTHTARYKDRLIRKCTSTYWTSRK